MNRTINRTVSSTDFVGEKVRKYRLLRNLTQEQLSEMVNTSLTYIQAVEAGGEIPSIDLFLRISDVLEVYPGQLLSPDTFEEIQENSYILPSTSVQNLCYASDMIQNILSQYHASPDTGSLGRRIADIRTATNMSRKELAQYAEISTAHLGNIESSTQFTTLKTLTKIQSQFNAPVEYFLQDSNLSAAYYMFCRSIADAKCTLPPEKYAALEQIVDFLFSLLQ